MRERIPSVNMAFYVDMQTIEAIHTTLGIPMKHGLGAETSQQQQQQQQEDDEEESDPEELIEEDYSAVNLTTTGTSSCWQQTDHLNVIIVITGNFIYYLEIFNSNSNYDLNKYQCS